jgi:hypothetical protein
MLPRLLHRTPRLPGGEDKRRSRKPAYAILRRHTARRQGAVGVRDEPGRELLHNHRIGSSGRDGEDSPEFCGLRARLCPRVLVKGLRSQASLRRLSPTCDGSMWRLRLRSSASTGRVGSEFLTDGARSLPMTEASNRHGELGHRFLSCGRTPLSLRSGSHGQQGRGTLAVDDHRWPRSSPLRWKRGGVP